jgi:uncharacterized protein (TIGR02246 family)
MRSFGLLLMLAMIGCAPAAELPEGLTEADEAAIRETYQAFSAAQETDEIHHLGRFFTEDALWISQMDAPVRGRDEIEAWFQIKAVNSGVEIEEIRGAGDLAYVVATRTLTLDRPDWVTVPCTLLNVWEKQSDGSWLIARYASVCAPQPS